MANAGYWWSTVQWYGGLGLLTGQVARNLALPPKYGRLVIQEIEVMGVRSAGVALIAASFTGMVLALQSGGNVRRETQRNRRSQRDSVDWVKRFTHLPPRFTYPEPM